MKAVSVLLCLALAHGITASIFREQDYRLEGLDEPQQEYIDEQLQQHRNQPSDNRRQRYQNVNQQRDQKNQRTQTRDQQREQERSQELAQQRIQEQAQQRAQQRDQVYEQESDELRIQRDEQRDHQSHQWSKPQKAKYTEQSLYRKPNNNQQTPQKSYRRIQYQSSAQEAQEEEKEQHPTYKHSRYSHHQEKTHQHQKSHHHEKGHHHQKNHRNTDSTSMESSRNSQESKEIREDNSKAESTQQTENQKWNSPLYSSVMNEQYQMVPVYDGMEWNDLQMEDVAYAPVLDKDMMDTIFADAQNAMKHISDEEKTKFHEAYSLAKEQNNREAELNATQLAQKYQYPVEEHTIKTADGYMLTLFRIPSKKFNVRDVQKRPVVFLMHGILGSADDWLLMGPGKSLAFLLSDAGYDVWLGNARGNKYSRRHVSKHRAVPDFWQFSNDEIALHDLPAMIDYALQISQQKSLYYIGHSQGTTAFFALAATRPEYNDKIIMMYALSPMAYMTNVRSPLFRMIAPTSKSYQALQQQLGSADFTPTKELIKNVGGSMLENEIGCEKVSSHVNFVMAGINVEDLNPNLIPVVMAHLPAGTSTKVIKQFGQGVASHEFRRYDYGVKVNQRVYGNEQPPKYDMQNVYAPVTLFYSQDDWLAHPDDVERLEKELPNVRETHKVSNKHFSNMDFQFSDQAPEMIYNKVIKSMEKNQ